MSLDTVLLRDEFSDVAAPGSVNGTLSDSGHTRKVIDTNNLISISGGKLAIAAAPSGTGGNPQLWTPSITRAPGVVAIMGVQREVDAGGNLYFGFSDNNTTWNATRNFFHSSGTSITSREPSIDVGVFSLTSQRKFAIALRSSGAFYFVESNGKMLMVRIDSAINGSINYLSINSTIAASASYLDYWRVAGYWLPSPLVSHGFDVVSPSDGNGHAETNGLGSGGSGVVMTQQAGAWTISGGKLQASALSSGAAIVTALSSTTDQLVGLDITRSAGDIGIILRYTDSSNYVRAIHNGTNLQVIKKIAGIDTTVINAAATYSAGKKIWIWTNGTAFRAYFNDALIGSATISDSVLQSGVIGVYTSDLGNTGDNLVSYAVGTNNEYATVFDIVLNSSATERSGDYAAMSTVMELPSGVIEHGSDNDHGLLGTGLRSVIAAKVYGPSSLN